MRLSPITLRRVKRFKRNRRAWYSLIIFVSLFVISLFAEFAANDKPIFMYYDGKLYFPAVIKYAETDFGGFFESEPDYKDSFMTGIMEKSFSIWPPVRFSYDTIEYGSDVPPPSPPTLENPLGLDEQGRDVFARLIYGFRLSVIFGFLLTLTSSAIGIAVGAVQGYYGGRADLLGQRLIELWAGIPTLYVLIIASSLIRPGFWWLLLIMTLMGWVRLVSVVRAEFLKGRNLEYVQAARALGVRDSAIMFRHILPNAVVAAMTFIPFILSGSIGMLTSLDFLGFGMPPGSPSIGELLSSGKNNPYAPWLGISAFAVLSVMLSLLVFIGEGLRDAFDPRHVKRSTPPAVRRKKPESGRKEDLNGFLSLENFKVSFYADFCVCGGSGKIEAVKDFSFRMKKGEMLAVVGESGSGKTVAALSITGLLKRDGAVKEGGFVSFMGHEIDYWDEGLLRKIRGGGISYIFQEPMASLNPLHNIERQITERLIYVEGVSPRIARARALELLNLVGIKNPESRLKDLPCCFSGGERQRIMIASALASSAELLIADEPTTALDVTVQKQILDLLAGLKERLGLSVMLITHNLGIVRNYADRVVVVKDGRVEEEGTAERIFAAPSSEYTRRLIAVRSEKAAPPVLTGETLLKADNISVVYRGGSGRLGKKPDLEAVKNVSLSIEKGMNLGVVGESGSGKSSLIKALDQLIPYSGRVEFKGELLTGMSDRDLRKARKSFQIVFQDPFGSLNPRMTVGAIIAEGLIAQGEKDKKEIEKRVALSLEEVGLPPDSAERYPHEFSGGQRQRAAIARAMIMRPDFVMFDEPTSSLDRSVQFQIVALLKDLQKRYSMTYVFVSHDFNLVRSLCHRIVVMKDGEAVEEGEAEKVLRSPENIYTKTLINAAFLD